MIVTPTLLINKRMMAESGKLYYAENYRQKFMAVFPELIDQLTDEGIHDVKICDGMQHLKEVCVIL